MLFSATHFSSLPAPKSTLQPACCLLQFKVHFLEGAKLCNCIFFPPSPDFLSIHAKTKREIKPRRRKSEHCRHLAIIKILQHQAKNNVKTGTTSQHPPSSESNEKRNDQHENTHRNCVDKKTFHHFIQTMMVVLSGNTPREEVIEQIKQLMQPPHGGLWTE